MSLVRQQRVCRALWLASLIVLLPRGPLLAQILAGEAKTDATEPASTSAVPFRWTFNFDAQQAPATIMPPQSLPAWVPPANPPDRRSVMIAQYAMFLGFEHSLRMFQQKTRQELDGPFLPDYLDSVRGLRGWGDGDSALTNYVGHPMQGAITGFIQIQNDLYGRRAVFGLNRAYWTSRLKALGGSALYSAQFELGPISEASIGNVGKRRGTMGYVDLVMTPVGGLAWIVVEDVLDRFVIAPLEQRLPRELGNTLRALLNPNRAAANVIRIRTPWKRIARPAIPNQADWQ